MIKKLGQIKKAIFFKEGIDKQYDNECFKSFIRFLDIILYIFYFIYFVVASLSIYFFITKEILWENANKLLKL